MKQELGQIVELHVTRRQTINAIKTAFSGSEVSMVLSSLVGTLQAMSKPNVSKLITEDQRQIGVQRLKSLVTKFFISVAPKKQEALLKGWSDIGIELSFDEAFEDEPPVKEQMSMAYRWNLFSTMTMPDLDPNSVQYRECKKIFYAAVAESIVVFKDAVGDPGTSEDEGIKMLENTLSEISEFMNSLV